MSHPHPFATVVHERIDDLRREAAADALLRAARRAQPARPARRRWPGPVVEGLRAVFGRDAATRPARRSGAPCPTC